MPTTPSLRPRWGRFDREILASCLASGAIWLTLFVSLDVYVLVAVGFCYVLLASMFLAFSYDGGRRASNRRIAAWLVAVVLWLLMLSPGNGERVGLGPPWVLVSLAIMLGSVCFGAWQAVALMLSHFVTGRSPQV